MIGNIKPSMIRFALYYPPPITTPLILGFIHIKSVSVMTLVSTRRQNLALPKAVAFPNNGSQYAVNQTIARNNNTHVSEHNI